MKAIPHDRPSGAGHRVHDVRDDEGILIASITVYSNGSALFGFDTGRRYTAEELTKLLTISNLIDLKHEVTVNI